MRSNRVSNAHPRRGQDRGFSMVLVAMLLLVLLMTTAVVVDISVIRVDRRTNKSAADFAASGGMSEIDLGPWQAVCRSFEYLKVQDPKFASLGTPTYTNGAGTTVAGCAGSTGPCTTSTASWARLTATSSNGNLQVEISSPYDPATDPDFATQEAAHVGDVGAPCEQVGVKITEARRPFFAGVLGATTGSSRIRSVARRTPGGEQEPAALILLERRTCNVLQTGGNDTRVIARAILDKPGIIQIDSDGTEACNSQPMINGQSTSGGPSIMACSVAQTLNGCVPGTGSRQSIVGVYAAAVNPGGNIAPAYSGGTYGDTPYRPAGLFTRRPVDERYGPHVRALNTRLTSLFAGSPMTNPPGAGCAALDGNSRCVDSEGRTWLVLSGASCDPATATSLASADLNVWFNCAGNGANSPYSIGSLLELPVTQRVVFNTDNGVLISGSSAEVRVPNAREVFVRGTTNGGNPLGLQVTSGALLNLNANGAGSCSAAAPTGSNILAILNGAYDVGGAAVRSCWTTTFLASGGSTVPASDGTAPCPSTDNATPCGTYRGKINFGSGAVLDWIAPDQESIPVCRPGGSTPCYDGTLANPARGFEDLALWGEAATGNVVNGGGTSVLGGIVFLPNADDFKLTGNGDVPIALNAQFIVRKLNVTGNATILLVPDPADQITVQIPSSALIR